VKSRVGTGTHIKQTIEIRMKTEGKKGKVSGVDRWKHMSKGKGKGRL